MAVLVGTSGWHYGDWSGVVYPKETPKRLWLAHFATLFPTVELNNSFYRLPTRSAFEAWSAQTPDGFVFAIKASRYLTHVRRLRDPEEPVALFMSRAEGLGGKCGPVLLQLPPNLRADPDALDRTLAAFPEHQRVAVELRHPSWQDPQVRKVLESHRAACCWADRLGPLQPRWKTAPWGYLRFHEGNASPPTAYGRRALETAAEEVRRSFSAGEDLYVYFNNDAHACAVANATTFRSLLGE